MYLVRNHRNLADTAFNHFFNRSIGDFIGSDVVNSYPAVNIHETNENFLIELAAPGLSKEDFQIQLEKNQLRVSAKKENGQAEEGTNYTRREFSYSTFKRSFTLPDTVDSENINANYEHGVLYLAIPKKQEVKLTPKMITVE
jgi:HSP20 family protein